MRERTRVLLVDTAGVSPGLRAAIERDPGLHVVAHVRDAQQVLPSLRRESPEVVVVEVRHDSDVAVVEQVMGFHPLPVLALSATADRQASLAVRAMVAGAADVLPSPTDGE